MQRPLGCVAEHLRPLRAVGYPAGEHRLFRQGLDSFEACDVIHVTEDDAFINRSQDVGQAGGRLDP